MALHSVVGISLTRKALYRALWAADERHDWPERNRLGALLDDLDDIELEMPARSDEDAREKLRFAARELNIQGQNAVARLLVGIAARMRTGPELRHLIDLRRIAALVPLLAMDEGALEQVLPRIKAALVWLAKPRRVAPVSEPPRLG
jgi:hypothetical protein